MKHIRLGLCVWAWLAVQAAADSLVPLADVQADALSAPDAVARVLDGNPATVSTFSSAEGASVDLLFDFRGETVAPEALVLTFAEGGPAPARVDVLTSTVSAHAGFTSLRAERVDSLKVTQRVPLATAAANWVLVRLFPASGAEALTLADLAIEGHVGPPETVYAFGETPAAALEILSAMRGIGAVDMDLTMAEAEIFRRAQAGALSSEDFETVALLASGVTTPEERVRFQDRLAQLTAGAEAALPQGAPAERGAALLQWLHENALGGGYRAGQTNLSDLLETGVFNCVSSAVLYNAVAGRLGLDVRAVEVPDHAFSIVYDGLDHMDVETTTARGFDPRREKIAEFESLTGFSYIPQSNPAKRREIDAAGLAALIYYNHGVTHLRQGRYPEALFANFRAMSLDPGFASSATNALAALGRWSTDLAEAEAWEDAVEVAAVGRRLAPQDRGLAATHRTIWQRWAFAQADRHGPEAAFAVLARAEQANIEADFTALRSAVLIRPAEAMIKTGDWSGALAQTDDADRWLSGAALSDLTDWRIGVHQRWARAAMEAGDFSSALTRLQRGLTAYPGAAPLARNVRYLTQEWAREGDIDQGLAAVAQVRAALPQVDGIDDVALTMVRRRIAAGLHRPLAEALADTDRAAAVLGASHAADLGAFVYETYGHARIEARDWPAAARIYAAGRRAHPTSTILTGNARYLAQEWQRAALAADGPEGLNRTLAELRRLFPDFAVDPGFGEAEIVRQVNTALRQGDFAAAAQALDRAQLLVRPETHQKIWRAIVDGEARAAMKARHWSRAGTLYSQARRDQADPTLFANNVRYLAQEWTGDVAASGVDAVAAAMGELTTLFPGDAQVAAMGRITLGRMVAGHLDAGRLDQAEATVRAARAFLGRSEAGELLIGLYQRQAQRAIDAGQWQAAMQAYADGLSAAPGAQDLRRNLPYVTQEWSRTALAEGGAPDLLAALEQMNAILPDATGRSDVLKNVVGREVLDMVARGAAEPALDLIGALAPALPARTVSDLKVRAYDGWARTRMDAQDWAGAVQIYDSGLAEVPGSSHLKNNRAYAASKL